MKPMIKKAEPEKLTRRELIKKTALGVGGIGLLSFLAGCTENEALDVIFAKTGHFEYIYLQGELLDSSSFGIQSNPSVGKRRVTNIYWNQETNRLRVVYAKE